VNVALWIVASVFAAWCLGAGLTKMIQPREKLATGWVWVEDFSPGAIKAIGALQVAVAFGLILPPSLGMAPVLVSLAALAVAALMTGAAIMHHRRNEIRMILPRVILLLLAVFVAWGRFGAYSF
jgi:hypothetical protein